MVGIREVALQIGHHDGIDRRGHQAILDSAGLLGLPALGDVAGHVHRAGDLAPLIEDRRDRYRENAAQPLVLDLGRMLPAVGHQPGVRAELRRHIQPVNAGVTELAHALLALQTQPLFHRLVGVDDPPVVVDDGYKIGHRVKRSLPVLLGLRDGVLRLLPLGNVGHDPPQPHAGSLADDGRGVDVGREGAAVLSQGNVFADLIGDPLGDDPVDALPHPLPMLGREHLKGAQSGRDILRGVSEHPHRAFVDERDAARRVDLEHGLRQ